MKSNSLIKLLKSILIGIAVASVISVFYISGFFTKLEYITSDLRRKLVRFQNITPCEDIVFFFIDQKSIDELKEEGIYWPWPRSVSADIINYLNSGGAKAIVFDVLYSEPSVYGENDDIIYAESAKDAGNLIIAYIFSNRTDYETENLLINEYINDRALNIEFVNTKVNIDEFSFVQPPIKLFVESSLNIGSVNIKADLDGLYRRSSLLTKYNDLYFPNISLTILSSLWDFKNIKISGNSMIIMENDVEHRYILNTEGELGIKFYGEMRKTYQNYTIGAIIKSASFFISGDFLEMYNEYNTYLELFGEYENIKEKIANGEDCISSFKKFNSCLKELYSFKYDSLQGMLSEFDDELIQSIKEEEFFIIQEAIENYEKNYIAPSTFKDKIVFIAGTAPGLYDLRPNPFNQKDGGVFIHASLLDNLLQDDYIIEHYELYIILTLIFIFSIFTSVLGSKFKIFFGILFTMIILFGYLLLTIISFIFFNTLLDFSAVPVVIIFSFLSGTILNYIQESREKNFIKNAFGQYLSTKVINELISNPDKLKIGGERKIMTAFFSDITGFTKVSESISPEELVHLLNVYLSEMCNIISKYDGIVDKFEGDAIIAFWGAPFDQEDHAIKACNTSVDMQKKMIELRKVWKEQGKAQLKVRIGINSGSMVVGNLGSNERMDYTIMGDSVNLTSRLEGTNKFYGTYSMISEFTYALVKNYFDVRELDKIIVIGRNEPVTIYELLDKKNEINPLIKKGIDNYSLALSLYRGKRFEESLKAFFNVLSYIPDDPPSLIFISRCKNFIENPPDDNWNGIFELTSK